MRQNHLPDLSRLNCLEYQSVYSKSSVRLSSLFKWFKSKIMTLLTENSQSQPRSEFAHQTNLHNLLSRLENKNLKSPRRRKLGRKLHDIFIFLCFRSSYQRKSATVFNGLVWTWEISPKKERVLLTNFRKLSNPYIQYIHTYIYKNWHTFPTPEISNNLG